MNKTLLSIALISILGFTVNANANTVIVGLADAPSDFDYQDLTFSISAATNALSVAKTTDGIWLEETGQSIPTGTVGQKNALVSFSGSPTDILTFTYGPTPPYGLPHPPATGYGNAGNTNLVWFGVNTLAGEKAAIQDGHYFANHAGSVDGQAFAASTVGGIGGMFTVAAGASPVAFQFNYDITGGNHTDLPNGAQPTDNGSYLAAAVPEPMTLIMLGLGLLGFGYSRRYVSSDVKGLSA